MKREDQILSTRLQNDAARDKLVQNARDRDRLLSKPANGELPLPIPADLAGDDDGAATPSAAEDPARIIVVHPGSQNLRIGFASDALPKTMPTTLATKYAQTEAELYEALPRRQFEAKTTDQQYGEEWSKKYQKCAVTSRSRCAQISARSFRTPRSLSRPSIAEPSRKSSSSTTTPRGGVDGPKHIKGFGCGRIVLHRQRGASYP